MTSVFRILADVNDCLEGRNGSGHTYSDIVLNTLVDVNDCIGGRVEVETHVFDLVLMTLVYMVVLTDGWRCKPMCGLGA